MKNKIRASDFLINNSIFFAIAVLVIITQIHKPEFLSAVPLNLLNRTAAYVIMTLGMGFVLMVGGVDLSAGRLMVFTALVAESLLVNPEAINRYFPNLPIVPIFPVFILVVAGGAAVGLISGLFVGKAKIQPYIVTLCVQFMLFGSMLAYRGLDSYGGGGISNLRPEYKSLITGFNATEFLKLPFNFPNYVFYSIIIVIIVWLIWNHTSFGKKLRLFGENHEAAESLNINPLWITIGAFVIAGALFGLNGFIEAARVGVPGASYGLGAELDAITACLIGGVSLGGGKGKVGGVVLGVMAFQLVLVSLQWLSVGVTYVNIIKGVLVLWAATIDARKNYRGRGVSGWKWR